MKHLRIFDSVSDMETALASATIPMLGLAYDNGQPVMKNKVIPPTPVIRYTVTTSVNPANPAGGVITGAEGTFTSGQTVTLTATPNDGYEFYRWRDASGYHTENPYVFTITGNTTVRAYFNVAEIRYNVSIINGTPGSEQYVTIEGAGQKVQGGTFTVSATYSYPYNGCHWYLNGQEVSAGDSYNYTNGGDGIQNDLEFTVYFDYVPPQDNNE